jgi:hypothetical protein
MNICPNIVSRAALEMSRRQSRKREGQKNEDHHDNARSCDSESDPEVQTHAPSPILGSPRERINALDRTSEHLARPLPAKRGRPPEGDRRLVREGVRGARPWAGPTAPPDATKNPRGGIRRKTLAQRVLPGRRAKRKVRHIIGVEGNSSAPRTRLLA